MNRLIIRYRVPLAIIILAILARVVYLRFTTGGSTLTGFAAAAIAVWIVGTFVFIYLWPSFSYSAYKRAILNRFKEGDPLPLNTLYAVPYLASPDAPSSSLFATATRDLLYVGGWLDLSQGPQILHVPDFSGRYYSVQFTDPSDGADFAYVGSRTTGSQAGDFLITGPSWQGALQAGMKQISTPSNSVMVMGRVFVENESDLPAALELARQMQLTPLN